MTIKAIRQIQHHLEMIMRPYAEHEERELATPEWYHVACVLRSLLEEIAIDAQQ